MGAVNAARDVAWSSVGSVDPYVVAHLINPAFVGGTQWPGLRQSFRKITRADGLAIVASDGLADPYLDDPAAGPGLGAELYFCSTAFASTPVSDLGSLWQFETVYQAAQNIASMQVELGPQLERYGTLSLSLHGSSAPAEWLDDDGTLGVLLGIPLHGVPVGVDVPNGAVRLVGITPLRPAELSYILAGGVEARRDVANRLTRLPASVGASPDRPSVIDPPTSGAGGVGARVVAGADHAARPVTSLEESLDPELLAVAARWFGGVNPVWRHGEWLCYDAKTDGIVISGEPGAVKVFFNIHQGDRDGGPDVVCTDPLDALRYVLFNAGVKQRQRYLYGRLLVPFSPSLARPGFLITPNRGLGATLTMEDAEGPASARRLEFRMGGEATEATFYLNAGLQEILDSIHTPSGEPLFGDVRQVQPTSVEYARP
ncbi:hypothetical protein C4K88_16665 [Arthrobacter pityocampae]|uniref:Suppressor of fused-like domain-containing protein n=1 Tax=Arthrobacter pityocampae TaxID=547334 RepID=A0A2S5ITF1_9MICC|nr:hypothetical protein C4K88_16665 [Arthrobacter pityocampae]